MRVRWRDERKEKETKKKGKQQEGEKKGELERGIEEKSKEIKEGRQIGRDGGKEGGRGGRERYYNCEVYFQLQRKLKGVFTHEGNAATFELSQLLVNNLSPILFLEKPIKKITILPNLILMQLSVGSVLGLLSRVTRHTYVCLCMWRG